jgi:hypothetical protein
MRDDIASASGFAPRHRFCGLTTQEFLTLALNGEVQDALPSERVSIAQEVCNEVSETKQAAIKVRPSFDSGIDETGLQWIEDL